MPPLNVPERDEDIPMSVAGGLAVGVLTVSVGFTITCTEEEAAVVTGVPELSFTVTQYQMVDVGETVSVVEVVLRELVVLTSVEAAEQLLVELLYSLTV